MRGQQIIERVKERYGKIALTGNNSVCCCYSGSQEECASENGSSPMQSAKVVGYDNKDLTYVPETSIFGV
jgi:arsenite methyltransferase